MGNVRRRMLDYQTIRSAVELANEGDPVGAKIALDELISTDPDMAALKEAQRILREIAEQEKRLPVVPLD